MDIGQGTVESVHAASLALLEDPGVRIEHDLVFDRLCRAGARPGVGAQVVRIPKAMVEETLRLAPAKVFLADRRSGGYAVAPDSESRVWTAPGMYWVQRNHRRSFTSNDMAALARLADQLPHVDGVFSVSLDDVPPSARDVVGLRIMAENTRKHIRVLCFTPEGASALCEMKKVVAPGPWFSIGFTAHGPLRWTHLALDIFVRTAGHGIPVSVNGEPMAGASGPVTLEGTAAVGNAEILAGVVLNQVLEPGRPCVYNLGLAHTFDMRTAVAVTGGPENHVLASLSAALGRFYRLPSCSWVSTESVTADSQAALEKALGFYSHLESGVSLVWGVGQLESELSLSPAQAVMDNEILGYIARMRRAVEATPERLAVEAVRRVGIGGGFLTDDHTLAHYRQEFFEPGLLLRVKREKWVQDGGRTLAEAAEERAAGLMAAPAAPALPPEQQRELRGIESSFLARAPMAGA